MEYVDDHKPNYEQLSDDELEVRIKEIQSSVEDRQQTMSDEELLEMMSHSVY